MQIQVKLDKGYLPDEYAKYASVKEAGNPVVSFPFTLTGLPEGSKYLAWSLVDYLISKNAKFFSFYYWN